VEQPDKSQAVKRDLTPMSSKMPRSEALLYKARNRRPDDAHYQGVTVLKDGTKLFIKLWADCEVNGRQVLHIKFT